MYNVPNIHESYLINIDLLEFYYCKIFKYVQI